MNTLYYGDNLNILREYIKDESVDLIYLDPPFNSNRNYNVLFKNETGTESESQITAFEDTWHWNLQAEQTYNELITEPDQVGRMVEAFRGFISGQNKGNQMLAYLVMMAIRLKELHRVLKPTGSLYLHCDPTASHYLKILLDTIFGGKNFQNEIVWKRTTAHSDRAQGNVLHYGRIHDIILYFTKSSNATRNDVFTPYSKEYIENSYRHVDENGRRYQLDNITGPGGAAKGNPEYEFLGVTRYWRYSRTRMQELYDQGLIVQTNPGTVPRFKRYLDENKGVPIQDLIDDIKPAPQNESLGYPTQKPVALLERIISASSNEGDVVLDPFCGCGTTIEAAQKLGREWIGIDITHLSVGLQKLRLKDSFDLVAGKDYKVIGQPEDLGGARELAAKDKYGFQWWILPLIGAKAFGSEAGKKEGKKGADGGIDGMIVFTDDNSDKAKKVVVSVKGGGVNVAQIRDLGHVVEREKAAIGIFLTLENPTKPMIEEAVGKGFYHSDGWNKDYPRLQILTVEDILNGKQPELPPNIQTFKQAAKSIATKSDQGGLFAEMPENIDE
ncbi:MAG: DNA modification methylase [Acidobacteria bacterium OLB17]|nr:MAG: DNA modification methylase [Acidobacteria bacterium OLB17]MCZ2389493.1 site-specific DNA-methyltransferase [Acidobacteriota bacterium]